MKKNAMLKIAAILLVAVLLTTCAISTTFAKYVTKGNDFSAVARVATWGLTITNEATGLFDNEYLDNGDVLVSGQAKSTTNYTEDLDTVLAPGTKNDSVISIAVSGAPEVAYNLVATADVTLAGWSIDGVEHCPLVVKVGSDDFTLNADGITSIAALESAIELALVKALTGNTTLDSYTAGAEAIQRYDANTTPSVNVTVSWEWPGFVSDALDVKDTALGNQAAAGNAAVIEIEYTLKAEQIIVDSGFATPAA